MGEDDNDFRANATHDESVGTMGRRRFANTVFSLGFAGVSASLLSSDGGRAASRGEKQIVYGLTRDPEGNRNGGVEEQKDEFRPRRKRVPADWYDDFRSAVAAHHTLDVRHRNEVANSAVEPGEYGGQNASIRVEITAEEVRGEVPEYVEDTPVEVRRVEASEARSGERNSSGAVGAAAEASEAMEEIGNQVPGSVPIASEDLYGTLAPAMRDPTDGSRYFATANHVFGGTGNQGDPLYLLDGDRTEIGSVQSGYPKSDMVCIRPESGYEPLSRIRQESPGQVLGQFTKVGLADLKAAGEPLEKIGVKTGHTKGKIQAVDGFTCAYGAICKQGQLKWGGESGFDDGDSGSVNYHADPEDPDAGVLVGGFNNARTWWPGEDYIWGTAAHHITEKHGFTF